MLPQSLAHRILVEMELAGDAPDDRVQDAVARSKPVKDCVNAIWPAVDPARLLWRLLSEPVFLADAADGILDPAEQGALLWPRPPRSAGAARWSLADAVLLDEAADLVQRTPSLAHIVADEAQDLSPMMLRALARRSSTGSLTVLGDLAQATTPWATRTWAEALGHLGKPDAHIEELTRGFRVPGRRHRVRRPPAARDRSGTGSADVRTSRPRRPVGPGRSPARSPTPSSRRC